MKRRIPIVFGLAAMAAAVAMAADAPAPAKRPLVQPKSAVAGKPALAAKPAAAPQKLAPSSLSAAQVVEKNVAARGGLTAWRAVTSLTMSGEMDAGGKTDARLPFTMTMKRPHKNRLELKFQDQMAVQVWDGQQGWKLRPFLNRNEVEPYTPAQSKSASAAAELDGPLVDFAAKGTRVDMEGVDVVEGKNAFKLKLTQKEGTVLNVWVDAVSFLEVKIDGEPRRIDGRMHKVAVFYRDFRSEGGLNVPHTLETVVEGVKGSHKMSIQSVKVNPALDDRLFGKPQLALAKAAQ